MDEKKYLGTFKGEKVYLLPNGHIWSGFEMQFPIDMNGTFENWLRRRGVK